ncbi:acid membrane antigen A [Campylobacter blaseri]|uniref:AI-2E family transporter n=1 Tax=Campylobacter blaseri TaxID=2042961 RepID=A0A2P8QYH2_9BACT|nr:AI-2E family transporter [Campylobacter blaseri]PSM51295.1 AI-2E family transporter [Campylobacter blaseri]PSM52439.1 AI-2E family transporter [Campylobacter blaseri]QKF86232.1 acid membrane antigen A [Campylobacter blaseri]
MKTSKWFFISFILFVFCWVIYLFKPFLMTFSIGILLALSTSNIHQKILNLTKQKSLLSACLTTLTACLLFLVPFSYAISKLAIYGANIQFQDIKDILLTIKNYDYPIPDSLSFILPEFDNIFSSVNINKIASKSLEYASNIGKSSVNFIVDMGLILIFYFITNLYINQIIEYVKTYIPMEGEQFDYIFDQTSNTMSVVLYTTILNSVFQGFLFGAMVIFFGYDGFLLGILYAFACLIPIVGGGLVFVPVAIYELAKGDLIGGIFILSYSIIVVAFLADNIVKPFITKFINSKLVKEPANINEIIIFFAMLAGISTFGFWGIILGPAITTLFVATLKTYHNLKQSNQI